MSSEWRNAQNREMMWTAIQIHAWMSRFGTSLGLFVHSVLEDWKGTAYLVHQRAERHDTGANDRL